MQKQRSCALNPEAMYDGGYWQSTGIGRYVTARLQRNRGVATVSQCPPRVNQDVVSMRQEIMACLAAATAAFRTKTHSAEELPRSAEQQELPLWLYSSAVP